MTTHLVIGDPHADPEEDNSRFDMLAQVILDRRPDTIICMGDFANMNSLSSYDKGKKSFEGRRYKKDVEATRDALNRIWSPIEDLNARHRQTRHHYRQYKPLMLMLGGNHDEARIERAVEATPELDGVLDVKDLGYEEFGWTYVPYKEPIDVDGIDYCHHLPKRNSSHPLSGLYLGRKLIQARHKSATVGHTHMLDVWQEPDGQGKRLWGLSAGCFFEHTPSYAGEGAKYWWRGLIFKHNVNDGDYDPEFISMKTLREKYDG